MSAAASAKTHRVMLSRHGGGPIGEFTVEECGADLTAPANRLKGAIVMRIQDVAVDLHVELIAVDVKETKTPGVEVPAPYSYRELVARDPDLQEELNTYFVLNGEENPALLSVDGISYVVLIYPFAE